MTGEARAVNPFAVPGLGMRSARPLCPWLDGKHADYYVPVDHTQEAFDKFVADVGQSGDLLNYGRLVVTSGPKGCGKSSVINRCASWLQSELKRASIGLHIVDLAGECALAENIDRRMRLVHKALVRELVTHKALAPPEGPFPEDPEGAYAQISDALDPRVVVAVILPPIEVMEELVAYSGLIRKRLIFFAETNSSDAVAARRAQLRRAHRDDPIELSVGPLHPEDFWTFVRARLERADIEPPPYTVSAATMGQLSRNAGNLWSVRRLHAMLMGAYEAKLAEPQSDGELSANEIALYGVHMFLSEEGPG
jgi:hypothetical protein